MESFFDFYRAHEQYFAGTQLVLAMLGMGATLTIQQFRDILRTPKHIGLVLLLQFAVMPVMAIGLATLADLPHEITIGVVLLVTLPSGSQSNIITFLGRGNVPLSITATCASTVSCLAITPFALRLFAARQLPDHFQIPVDKTILNICLLLLLPLAIGMLIRRWLPAWKHQVSQWAIGGSLVALTAIVVGALGGGRIDVFSYGWKTPTFIIVFLVASLLLTYWLTLLLRYTKPDAYTLAVEVSMRNGNLGVALCIPLFDQPSESNLLYQGGLYACLFGGGAMMVIGLIAASRRQWRYAHKRRAGLGEA